MDDLKDFTLEQKKTLLAECQPHPATSNFEQLCRLMIVGLGFIMELAIKAHKD